MNIEITQNRNSLKSYYAIIPSTNYYNENQKIIRAIVSKDGEKIRYMDMYLAHNLDYPNPDNHVLILFTTEESISSSIGTFSSDDVRSNLPPGYQEKDVLSNNLSNGFAYLINKQKVLGTTNPCGMEMLNRTSKGPSDSKYIRQYMSPPTNRNYTTVDESTNEPNGNPHNENFGVFITDNGVYIKGPGESMIVLGEGGISFHGKKDENFTKGGRGIMQDNPLAGWIPATIMTVPAGIPFIPNIDKIILIGNIAYRLVNGIKVLGNITKLK